MSLTMRGTPTLAKGMALQLFLAAGEFAHNWGLPSRQGLVVCFENKAVAWMPDLTQHRAFPVGAFAVDGGAGTIYMRTQGQGWVFAYSTEGGES